jgi:hypothetical protein
MCIQIQTERPRLTIRRIKSGSVSCNFWQFDATRHLGYSQYAGWSSLVARRAHNPKVVSSNLTPATMGASEENPLSALLIYGYELSRNNSFA